MAPSEINAALADAPNSKLPSVNLSRDFLSLKKIIWLNACPPNWKPIDTWVNVVFPITFPFSNTSPLPLAPPIPIPPFPTFGKTA